MNVRKEVYQRCLNMIERELYNAQHELRVNKIEINNLAKKQRILKAEVGKLYELKKSFNQ